MKFPHCVVGLSVAILFCIPDFMRVLANFFITLLINTVSIFQSISKTGGLKSNNPSISITPVPGGRAASAGLKPGAPSSGGGKDNFVICEICDGYIRDLEQLRNHMQFIHKVKIHPKMIYNRPPLNCQKCQFRFFTDQVSKKVKIILFRNFY